MKKFLLCYAVLTTALLVCACRSCRHARGGKPASGRQPDRPRLRSRTLPHTAGRGGRLGAGAPPPLRRVRGAARGRRRPHPATGNQAAPGRSRGEELDADRRRTPRAAARHARSPPGGGPAWDTLRRFRWRDPWVTVEGSIGRDSVECRIRSVDTLRQVVHRVPRRFLFIRWGTKALRQQIVSSNPPHADRLHGVRPHRALTRTQPQDTPRRIKKSA